MMDIGSFHFKRAAESWSTLDRYSRYAFVSFQLLRLIICFFLVIYYPGQLTPAVWTIAQIINQLVLSLALRIDHINGLFARQAKRLPRLQIAFCIDFFEPRPKRFTVDPDMPVFVPFVWTTSRNIDHIHPVYVNLDFFG